MAKINVHSYNTRTRYPALSTNIRGRIDHKTKISNCNSPNLLISTSTQFLGQFPRITDYPLSLPRHSSNKYLPFNQYYLHFPNIYRNLSSYLFYKLGYFQSDRHPINTFAAGSISGIASKCITAPCDVLHFISNNKSTVIYTTKCEIHEIINKYGFRGLYNGNMMNCIRAIPYNGTITFSYQYFLSLFSKSYFNSVFSGALCGICAVLVTYPLDFINNTMKHIKSTYINPTHIYNEIYAIFKRSGIFSLYKGVNLPLIAFVPFISIQQSTQDIFRRYSFSIFGQSFGVLSICSLLTASVTILLTFPFTVISRYYLENRSSITKTVIHQIKLYGIKGLYHGFIPSFIKIVPSVGLGLAVRDKLLKRVD